MTALNKLTAERLLQEHGMHAENLTLYKETKDARLAYTQKRIAEIDSELKALGVTPPKP